MAKGSGSTRNKVTKERVISLTANGALEIHPVISENATKRLSNILEEHSVKGYTTDNYQFKFGTLSKDIVTKFKSLTGIEIKDKDVYTGASSLFHHRKGSKFEKGKVSSYESIVNLPTNIGSMDVYFFKKTIVFADKENKYVLVPNYEIKLPNGKRIVTNHVSSSKIIDKGIFSEKNGYKKVTL